MTSKGVTWSGEVTLSAGVRRPWRTKHEREMVENYDNPQDIHPRVAKRPLFGWTWMRYGQQKDMLMVGITVLGLSAQAVIHTYRSHRLPS